MWRILAFKIDYCDYTIIRLKVHLPNQQSVTFVEGNEEEALEVAQNIDTMLTAFFKLNEEIEAGETTQSQLLYFRVRAELRRKYRLSKGKQ